MRKTISGIITGILITVSFLVITGAKQTEEDSIKIYLQHLESFLRTELGKEKVSGRYQLQSFSIDRTHWHYMLDTATGELYRMELGRKPEYSEWILMSMGIGEDEESEIE